MIIENGFYTKTRMLPTELFIQLDRVRGIPYFDVLDNGDVCYYKGSRSFTKMQLFPFDLLDHKETLLAQSENYMLKLLYIVLSITRSVVRLHKLNIIHADLKPQNILVRNDYEFVISDYGMSIINDASCTDGCKSKYRNGTPKFMAPEVEKGMYSFRTDIYALAVTIISILTEGTLPENLQNYDLNTFDTTYIKTAGDTLKAQIIKQYFIPLLTDMTNFNPHKRPADDYLVKKMSEAVKLSIDYIYKLKADSSIDKSATMIVVDDVNDIVSFVQNFQETIISRTSNNVKKFKRLNDFYFEQLILDNWMFLEKASELGPESINPKIKTLMNDYPYRKRYYKESETYKDGLALNKNNCWTWFVNLFKKRRPVLI